MVMLHTRGKQENSARLSSHHGWCFPIAFSPSLGINTRTTLHLDQHKNIESMLDRGEKIDSLVEKSNDLNSQSKLFYKQVRQISECTVNVSPAKLVLTLVFGFVLFASR